MLVIDVHAGPFNPKPGPKDAKQVLARINSLTARANKAGGLVIYVQHDGASADQLAPFTPGWELDPRLNVDSQALRIRKTTCDAFYATPLLGELNSRGIKTLVVTGYATEFCVDSTVRTATNYDFCVVVGADAHTTHDNRVAKAFLIRELHNLTWANASLARPVTVCRANEIDWKS